MNLNPTECHSPSAVKGVWGTVIGYGANKVFSGWFDGRLNISGNAVVTNGAAPIFVGAGNAVGSIVQTGGELYAKEDSSKYWARSALVLGIFGGQGSYAMSGGKSEFNNHVYVGGVDLISVGRTEAQNHMPENDGSSSGVLEVSGGTFTACKSMYVGALGTGTVNLSGSGSLLIAESLVLSNSVPNAATVKLSVSGDSPPRFEIGGELVVRDGAKLEVDVSNFATTNVWTKLISCSSRTGSFASSNVKVVGEGVRGYLVFNRVNDDTGSIWWCRPRGTAVVIR